MVTLACRVGAGVNDRKPTAAVEDAPAARPTPKHATDFATTEAPRDPDIAYAQTSSGDLVVDIVSMILADT